MEPLWLLLKDVEDIRLTSDLLEPEIQVPTNSGVKTEANAFNSAFTGSKWNDKNRSINSEYENSVLNDQKNYTIKIEDSTGDEATNGVEQETVQVKKERPAWMLESTVTNINNSVNNNNNPLSDVLPQNSSKVKNKYSSKMNPIVSSNNSDSNEPSKEILETLLIHENKQENSSSAATLLLSDSTNHLQNSYNNSNDDNNEEVMMSDEEEDDAEVQQLMVTVGHQSIPLSDVNDEIIAQMSEPEKEEYIRLTQQVYAHMYDI